MSLFQSYPVVDLPIGITLGCAVYDENNTKLLAAGTAISQRLVQTLNKRDVTSVLINASDLGRLQAFRPQGRAKHAIPDREKIVCPKIENQFSQEMDTNLRAWLRTGADTRGPKFAERLKKETGHYDVALLEQMTLAHEEQVTHLSAAAHEVIRGGSELVVALAASCPGMMEKLITDSDAFTCLGGNPSGADYPGRHSLHVAMVSIAIGTAMGLDEDQLQNLTLGCLIHDLGMAEVDQYTLKSRKVLEPKEFEEITKHSVRIFELLETHLDHVSEGAWMVAYQMHERCDGSGYPRQRRGDEIHVLARIAGVADAFVALVAPRPHRSGLLSYYAIAKLLKDASAGKFDPNIVRHLLQVVSLFPLGSYVELNDNRVARVLRTSERYDRPVIELWDRGSIDPPGAIVDLSKEPELRVLRPLPSLR